MQKSSRHSAIVLLALSSSLAHAQTAQLTTDVPACRPFPGPALPEKYVKLAKTQKGYVWLGKIKPGEDRASGKGGERADGSSMYDWLNFFRTDIDNDGYCDWYLNASAPMSTGGDRDSINTLYLGRKNGWLRIGAAVPGNRPDELGFGKTMEEQERYLFGEDISVIHDAANKTNYFITAFYNRHVSHPSMPGYRIMVWDANKRNLRLLDKWEPGSRAAAVYAFFRQHGARRPAMKADKPSDTLEQFDPDTEAQEISEACDSTEAPRTRSEGGALSRHLLARCKR